MCCVWIPKAPIPQCSTRSSYCRTRDLTLPVVPYLGWLITQSITFFALVKKIYSSIVKVGFISHHFREPVRSITIHCCYSMLGSGAMGSTAPPVHAIILISQWVRLSKITTPKIIISAPPCAIFILASPFLQSNFFFCLLLIRFPEYNLLLQQ